MHIYHRSHILQADSEEMLQAWVSALQHGIGAALQLGMRCEAGPERSSMRGANSTPNDSPSLAVAAARKRQSELDAESHKKSK